MFIDILVHGLFAWSLGAAFEASIVLVQHIRWNYKCIVLALCTVILSFGAVAIGIIYGGLLPLMVLPIACISTIMIEKYMVEWNYHNYPVFRSSGYIRTTVMLCLLIFFGYICFRLRIYAPVALLYLACIAWKRGRDWIMSENVLFSDRV